MLGYCSRREGERLIASRRVAMNGQIVVTPATLIDPEVDVLAVDDKEIPRARPQPRYLAVHKPRGVVSTVHDRHAGRTVVELVASQGRLYPVGRLDKDSEGLIILTNDGSFANLVAHPRYETEREYLALLPTPPTQAAIEQLRRGVLLAGRPAVPFKVELLRQAPDLHRALSVSDVKPGERGSGPTAQSSRPGPSGAWLRIVLREGRNREVRRMLQAVGYPVQRLIRTRVGPVHLGKLRPGAHRDLSGREVRALLHGRSRT
jgi:23S rRNA pseudouridine2605 synthase